MQVPEGGQQRPLTRNVAPIVSCLARRGDCLRGVLSRMRRIKIQNRMGIGHGLGLGMFAPFGDGAFWAVSIPRFPCTFGAAVTWGYSCSPPSGTGLSWGASIPRFPCTFGAAVTWGYSCSPPPGPIICGAAIHVRTLRGQLSAEPLSARLSVALPDMAKGLLLPHRAGFANLRCALEPPRVHFPGFIFSLHLSPVRCLMSLMLGKEVIVYEL